MAATLTLSAALALAQSGRPEVPASVATQDRILPLEATVNGARGGSWPFVERQGVLYVTRDALEEWRLHIRGDMQPITARGGEYWPLNGIPGFSAKINYAQLSIDLSFSPDAFSGTQLKVTKELERPKPGPVLPSLFLNYDLNFQHSRSSSQASRDLGAVLEFGGSNDWGVVTSTHVGRNLSGGTEGPRGWLRLESTFTRHIPDSQLSLRAGDSTTRQGLWGRGVYFGGLQLGSNYSLTPGFLTQPLPLFTGVSAAPSTVELYINDQLRKVAQVPAGPFAIDNNALGFTGSGEARIVVRDILGREVVMVQPFFTSAHLLASGLADWSVEAGAVRENLGTTSNDYGHRFATGTWRRGMNDKLTLEARGEITRSHRTAGAGAIHALPWDALVRGAYARSRHDAAGSGHYWTLGLDKQWLVTAFSVQVLGATRGYRELGMAADALPVRRQWGVRLSHTFTQGTLGLAVARQERFDVEAVTTLSANYSMRIGARSSLNVNLSRVLGPSPGTSVGMTLQVPLDATSVASTIFSSHSGGQDLYATYSQSSTPEQRLGWRVMGGLLQNKVRSEAGADYSGRYGRVFSDLSVSSGQQSLRLGASGGMAMAAGRVFLAPRLDESFAVAELKGYPGVGIGLGSNPSTTTDAAGIAFIPNLSPWQTNQIRLDPRDLPISAELDSIEQSVVPSWRSAVKVDFPVRSGRGALLRLAQENGEPIPAGAIVQIVGDKEEFYTGRRGEAFVTGLQTANKLVVRWKGGQCSVDVTLPPANDDVPRIGPLTCQRSAR
ncbi:MAG: fimbrial biogenesis outer membrane usher protein [Burkholderiales bacterium]|nr:fimbrial biogenesis outer membrane usher protein [Burkholderiales bacterium]